jgi:hypothetical protein
MVRFALARKETVVMARSVRLRFLIPPGNPTALAGMDAFMADEEEEGEER